MQASVCAGDDEPPDPGPTARSPAWCPRRSRRSASRRAVRRRPEPLGDDPPVVAPPGELLVGVLVQTASSVPPRLLDKAADVRDNRGAVVRSSTTPRCTSTTRSAVFGRFSSVVMVAPSLTCCPRTVALPTDGGAVTGSSDGRPAAVGGRDGPVHVAGVVAEQPGDGRRSCSAVATPGIVVCMMKSGRALAMLGLEGRPRG